MSDCYEGTLFEVEPIDQFFSLCIKIGTILILFAIAFALVALGLYLIEKFRKTKTERENIEIQFRHQCSQHAVNPVMTDKDE